MSSKLTHINADGEPHIVDLSAKKNSRRLAQAEGWVELATATIQLIQSNAIHKGNVLSIAQLAGICGAKKTADIIPLCHPIPIDAVEVRLTLHENRGVHIMAEVRNEWKTGVEMEALMAVSSAALCVYDMIKAVQKNATITGICLLYKEGGKSGVFGKRILENNY